MSKQDELIILDEMVSFEEKLAQSLKVAKESINEYSLIIDADILIRKNLLQKVRKLCFRLPESKSGFGIQVFDFFHDLPKFRGIHIYRNRYIPQLWGNFPIPSGTLRPESYLKERVDELGHTWCNKKSLYVGGIHDFYQSTKEIAYKYFIRTHKNLSDGNLVEIKSQKNRFSKRQGYEYKAALEGIRIAEENEFELNNKILFCEKFKNELKELEEIDVKVPASIEWQLFYKFQKSYVPRLILRMQRIMNRF